MKGKILTTLRNNFITGLLIILPLVVTIWILTVILNAVVGFVPEEIVRIYFQIAPWKYIWKALVFIGVLLTVFLIGAFARNVIGGRFIGLGDKILARIPLVNKIYQASQQISQAFLGKRRSGFKRVILFQYPRLGLYTLGLVSGTGGAEIAQKTGEEMLTVFVPTTPNPTSGLLILVPEKDTIPLQMSVAEALKLLVSGGTIVPPYDGEGNA